MEPSDPDPQHLETPSVECNAETMSNPKKKTDIQFLLNDPGSSSAGASSARRDTLSPGKRYECPRCPRVFTDKGNLRKHIAGVHEKSRKHTCTVCGKKFAFHDGLRRHTSQVHLNERKYTCTTCGLSFKQASHLAKHQKALHKQ